MLAADVDAESPAELHSQYATALNAVVDDVGEERVRRDADLDAATVEAIRDGAGDVALEDAASVMALADDRTGAEIVAEVRDALLLDMSTAVVDVESIAADVEGLDPGEVQAKIEGRFPMTLREYATLRHYVSHR